MFAGDHAHGLKLCSVFAMVGQRFGREMALERGEAEKSSLVMLQDEAHQAVTKAADAVVKDDRIIQIIGLAKIP